MSHCFARIRPGFAEQDLGVMVMEIALHRTGVQYATDIEYMIALRPISRMLRSRMLKLSSSLRDAFPLARKDVAKP